MKVATQWEEAAGKALTETQARRVVGDIYEMIHGDALEKATVREFIDRWLGAKKVEASVVTFQKYTQISRQFLEFLGKKADAEISTVGAKELTAFRDTLATKVSPTTLNIALKVLGTLFAKAYRDGLIDSNPAPRVRRVAQRKREVEKRAFTVPELRGILECCDDEWRGLVLSGLYFGQRLKDIATLTWRNIDLSRGEFRLSTGKTGRRVLIRSRSQSSISQGAATA